MRIYLDFISPYAYLAWTQIGALAARHGRTVEPVPVLFPAMLDAFGTIGPAEIPVKRTYLFKDVVRKAKLLGVPLVVPPAHPFVPLLPLRVATAAKADRVRVVDALFTAVWGRGEAIDTKDDVARVLERASIDPELVAQAATHEVKRDLLRATQDAIAAGVFGVPMVEVPAAAGAELFWGLDALPSLEAFLRGDDPLTPELRDQLARLPMGAQRKRIPSASREPT